MIGQLTTLVVQDNTPLPLNSHNRVLAAKKFMDSSDAVKDLNFIYRNENKPPYYHSYKDSFHESSAALNQYALNDFMALG